MVGRADYFERKERKIERMEEKAFNAAKNSANYGATASKTLHSIPLGQPILVGHHSEKRARRDAEKIDTNMRKSVEEQGKADYYKERLKATKNNTAISSDNPNAIELLEEKIEKLTEQQKDLKEMNKYYKKHKTMIGFEGITEERAKEIDKRIDGDYSFNKKPAPSYVLSNLSQTIRSTKQRLEQLKVVDEMEDEEIDGDGFTINSNSETNRIEIYFDEKPSEEVRTKLKRNGFKWARSVGAWQRLRSPQSLRIAKRLLAVE